MHKNYEQKIEKKENKNTIVNLNKKTKIIDRTVLAIKRETVKDWLLNKHYAKRVPQITHSFGCFVDGILQGIITFGIPSSPSLCKGVCGEQWQNNVYELNRLAMIDGHDKNLVSYFVAKSIKLMPKPSIIVSYADTSMGHIGYVYQSTNFIYTGLSEKNYDWKEKGKNLHSRTIVRMYSLKNRQLNPDRFELVKRPQKHRYIYFLGSKKEVKQLNMDLNYKVQEYTKGTTKKYKNEKEVAQQMTFIKI